jgi:SAM-dependent methyltransferase
MICLNCNSCSRNRHVAKIIRDTFDPSAKTLQESINTLKNLDIYEASTSKPLRGVLSKSSKYVCSEYLGGVKPGEKNSDGILCEDLQNLSFENDSFDLVITEDVFEHIRSPTQAFREIKRILKPGGYHIFTIPFYFDRNTFTRIDVTTDKDVYIAPPVYHGDPLRKEGIIVYTDFGVDMFEYLESIGLKTELAISNYNDIKTEKIYDSYVFRSKKI